MNWKIIFVAVLCVIAWELGQAQTGTDQDFGYWEYQMSPEGNVWTNDAQGFGYPAYEPPQAPVRPRGYSYGYPEPRYFNEYGQPSNTPDRRQYWDVEPAGM